MGGVGGGASFNSFIRNNKKVTQELNISTNSKTVLFFMFAWLVISQKYKLQIDFISDRSLSDEL